MPVPELFANNEPGDLPCSVNKLSLVRVDGRWKTQSAGGTRFTAKGLHIFIVQHGQLVIARRIIGPDRSVVLTHADLADGNDVEFAGEVLFGGRSQQRGIVKLWNDKTGHYHDPSRKMDPMVVPTLPQDRFWRYEDKS